METNKQYEQLLDSIHVMHQKIRRKVRNDIKSQKQGLSDIVGAGNGDVSYGIDMESEKIIDEWFTNNPPEGGAIVISEGLGIKVYPKGINPSDASWRILIDPLDGTRHIMYDNRSCFILTGIAPNKGENTRLYDICAAIQTEVPTSLQDKGVVLRAIRNNGVQIKVYDLNTEAEIKEPILTAPSSSKTLENGFAVFSNFFPGTKEIICTLEENFLKSLYGEPVENGALIFSEQYICNAGQLYMLATGKYRMIADIRANLEKFQIQKGKKLPLCTHPYDLSASLIAEEAGCVLVNLEGKPLDYPLDLDTNCSWICYANKDLFSKLHPVLVTEMKSLSLIG
jgi:3'-phosphoadenosine 5'-phosphosulfate (PAPS) 3'-phosphatase